MVSWKPLHWIAVLTLATLTTTAAQAEDPHLTLTGLDGEPVGLKFFAQCWYDAIQKGENKVSDCLVEPFYLVPTWPDVTPSDWEIKSTELVVDALELSEINAYSVLIKEVSAQPLVKGGPELLRVRFRSEPRTTEGVVEATSWLVPDPNTTAWRPLVHIVDSAQRTGGALGCADVEELCRLEAWREDDPATWPDLRLSCVIQRTCKNPCNACEPLSYRRVTGLSFSDSHYRINPDLDRSDSLPPFSISGETGSTEVRLRSSCWNEALVEGTRHPESCRDLTPVIQASGDPFTLAPTPPSAPLPGLTPSVRPDLLQSLAPVQTGDGKTHLALTWSAVDEADVRYTMESWLSPAADGSMTTVLQYPKSWSGGEGDVCKSGNPQQTGRCVASAQHSEVTLTCRHEQRTCLPDSSIRHQARENTRTLSWRDGAWTLPPPTPSSTAGELVTLDGEAVAMDWDGACFEEQLPIPQAGSLTCSTLVGLQWASGRAGWRDLAEHEALDLGSALLSVRRFVLPEVGDAVLELRWSHPLEGSSTTTITERAWLTPSPTGWHELFRQVETEDQVLDAEGSATGRCRSGDVYRTTRTCALETVREGRMVWPDFIVVCTETTYSQGCEPRQSSESDLVFFNGERYAQKLQPTPTLRAAWAKKLGPSITTGLCEAAELSASCFAEQARVSQLDLRNDGTFDVVVQLGDQITVLSRVDDAWTSLLETRGERVEARGFVSADHYDLEVFRDTAPCRERFRYSQRRKNYRSLETGACP